MAISRKTVIAVAAGLVCCNLYLVNIMLVRSLPGDDSVANPDAVQGDDIVGGAAGAGQAVRPAAPVGGGGGGGNQAGDVGGAADGAPADPPKGLALPNDNDNGGSDRASGPGAGGGMTGSDDGAGSRKVSLEQLANNGDGSGSSDAGAETGAGGQEKTPKVVAPKDETPDEEEASEEEEELQACVMPEYDPFDFDPAYIKPGSNGGCPSYKTFAVLDHETHIVTVDCDEDAFWRAGSSGPVDRPIENGMFDASEASIVTVQCGSEYQYFAKVARDAEAHRRAQAYIRELSERTGRDASMMNIVTMSLDSMSRAQMIRRMTRTLEVMFDGTLDNFEVYDYDHFNVRGDGTLKALVPALIGYDAEDFAHVYNGWDKKLDDWPWIFYDLHDHGYVTQYGEDFGAGVFELNLKGFNKWPCTHTMKEFFTRLAKEGRHRSMGDDSSCIGNKQPDEHMYDHIKSILKTYPDVGSFSYHHFTAGHEPSLRHIQVLDHGLSQFLEWLNAEAADNTLVIIYGDHGPRYGAYRQTLAGKLEERLPACYILAPKMLNRAEDRAALAINQHRLTSVFDLHETYKVAATYNFPETIFGFRENKAQPITVPVPLNRTCESIDLESHWCACMVWHSMEIDAPQVVEVANLLVSEVNKLTGNGESECATLALETIQSAEVQDLVKKMATYKIGAPKESRWSSQTKLTEVNMRVQFVAQPGDAIFDGIVHSAKDGGGYSVVQISRISEYRKQHTCFDHPGHAMYCVCKNWLAGETKCRDCDNPDTPVDDKGRRLLSASG